MEIRLESRPTPDMIGRGIAVDALAVTDQGGKSIVIFLLNLFDRFGSEPGEFRKELRRCLLVRISEAAGTEMQWENEP